MRPLLLVLFAVLALAGESLTPEQQRQHEAWLEAMRKSAEAGKPTSSPAPRDPKSTPEYQASEAANRDAEAKRLRDEQAQWKAEREAREKAAAESRAKLEAEEAARWAEIRARQEREAQAERDERAADERRREAAVEQERQKKATAERWDMAKMALVLCVVVPLALALIALPGIIASWKGNPQKRSVDGLVVCAFLSALFSQKFDGLDTAAVLLWSAALALSLWRFKSP